MGAPPKTSRAQASGGARGKVVSAFALGMAQRVFALVATLAVLVVTFVSSYSVYLSQQRDIAEANAQIADHNAQIADLNDQLQRWQDPAYVRAQARDRLGWVMPGEVGYRVIDANGQIIGGTVGLTPAVDDTTPTPWYDTLWASLSAADQPTPPEGAQPTGPATIGPDGVETPR
ncbi:MAG: septum formation initiator family protein [Propionibacteriaceae bacterium]|nr:septum formation initiator family protein [Propionibacteriaceae bacterium]